MKPKISAVSSQQTPMQSPTATTPLPQATTSSIQTSPVPSHPRKKKQVSRVNTSGKESPAVGSITQGAGSALSFNQKGGVTAGTIIGAITPPPRVLSDEQVAELKAAVGGFPDTILIFYAERDEEAFHFAQQIGDSLTGWGWTLVQPVSSFTGFATGAPTYGMSITFPGPALAPGERSHPDPNTSSGRLIWTLMRMFPKDFTASSSPAAKLTLWVYPNPELQNK